MCPVLLGLPVSGKHNGRGGRLNGLGPPMLGNNDGVVQFRVGIGMWLWGVTKGIIIVTECGRPPDDGVSETTPIV